MPRVPLPLWVPDASRFAQAIGRQLKTRHASGLPPPGHVELLNLMARALGHRNLQSLQAAPVAASAASATPLPDPALPTPPLAPEDQPPPAALSANARKALMQFDSRGRLLRWPVKYSVQTLAMWLLWTLFDGRRVYSEREVNEVLKAAHCFEDHATLRRELINHRLLSRTPDCAEYRKLPARPDDEARALLQAWRQMRRQAGAAAAARVAAAPASAKLPV